MIISIKAKGLIYLVHNIVYSEGVNMNIWIIFIIVLAAVLYCVWISRPTAVKIISKAIKVEEMYKRIWAEKIDTSIEDNRVILSGKIFILLEEAKSVLQYRERLSKDDFNNPEVRTHLKEITRIREEMGEMKANIDMM